MVAEKEQEKKVAAAARLVGSRIRLPLNPLSHWCPTESVSPRHCKSGMD